MTWAKSPTWHTSLALPLGGGMKSPSYLTRAPAPQGNATLCTAMRLAVHYQHRTPLAAELQSEFGMSRATAYRWVQAFKAAKAEHADA